MMFDPEANANAARARMRQQQYMRLGDTCDQLQDLYFVITVCFVQCCCVSTAALYDNVTHGWKWQS